MVLHYEDLPAQDCTVLDGIPVTTALRTVIDLAGSLGRVALEAMVADYIDRGLFTHEEARRRLAEPDLQHRRGAALVRAILG